MDTFIELSFSRRNGFVVVFYIGNLSLTLLEESQNCFMVYHHINIMGGCMMHLAYECHGISHRDSKDNQY